MNFKKGDAGNSFIMLWGRELNTAKKIGLESIRIAGRIKYEKTQILFDRYVTHFFEQKARAADQPALRCIAKLFMNSLYGKLGQNTHEQI